MVAPLPSVLVALVTLIDRIPAPARRGRWRRTYSDRLFLKSLAIMLVRHLPKVHLILAALRALLTEQGRYPSRRTFEPGTPKGWAALPEALPAQVGCWGRVLVRLVPRWGGAGRAAGIDSTAPVASGGVRHREDRERGVMPHSSIGTEAHRTKSSWRVPRRGGVYGWKLRLVVAVASAWIPLAATLTPSNVADNDEAPWLLPALPAAVRYLPGDVHCNDATVRTVEARRSSARHHPARALPAH